MNRDRTDTNTGTNQEFNPDSDDRRLVAFLQQNKPIAPAPAFNLEQRLMAEIGRQAIPQGQSQSAGKLWRKGLLVTAGAIAAGIMSVWAINRQMQPAAISEVDRAQIEASLIKSWSASVGEDPDETTNSFLITDLHEETNETSQ